jgi:hypothetical protein
VLIAVIAVGVFVVLALAGGAALALFLTRAPGAHYPKEWDPRVKDIVAFDESTRGLTYKHPVDIEFLSDDDFTQKVTSSEADLSAKDRAEIDQYTAMYRALGLIGGDVDLFKESNDLKGGGSLAYYDPKAKKIRVRGTELTPAVRVTLAHEMTHVLQDQYFDLGRLTRIKSEGERTALRSVVEGDATDVQNAYVDQLSAADKQAYADESQKSSDNAGYAKAPQVLVANFTAPYVLGPAFVSVLRQKGGYTAVNDAIVHPPASEASLLDIFTYFAGAVPSQVDAPKPEDGQKRLQDGEFGATQWYVMLARRLDVHDAVKALDGWGGDSFLAYEGSDGKVCVKARYQGKTSAASDTMQGLLDRWVAQSPSGTGSVSRDGEIVELVSCDPGSDAQPPGTDQSTLAIELLALRLQVVEDGLKQGVSGERLDCIATGLIDRLNLADLDPAADVATTRQKVQDSLKAAAGTCT